MSATVSIERLPASRVRCDLTFSPEVVAPAEEQALRTLGESVSLKGFRPGKAPLEILREKIDKEQLLEETVRILVNGKLPAVLSEQKITPILRPRVEMTSREPIKLSVFLVERPKVEIKGLDTLTIEKKEAKVDPKDRERVLASLLREHRTFAVVSREAKKGDQLTLDLSAQDHEGKDISGMRAEGHRIQLGDDALLPGLEDHLLGLKAGEEKRFTITMPESYQVEELKGKPLAFSVRGKAVEEVKAPELTDVFAKEKLGAENVADLHASIDKAILAQEEQFEATRRERAFFDEVVKRTEVEIAPELLDEEVQMILQELSESLKERGQSFEDWQPRQGKTPEQLREEFQKQAERRLKLRLGMGKIIEEKHVTVSDEEMDGIIRAALQEIPTEQRLEAAGRVQKGSAPYEELKWRTLVEKSVTLFVR